GYYAIAAPFPPDSWYGSSTAQLKERHGYRSPKDQDIAEAKALLKAAGYDPPAKLGKRVLTVPTVLYWPDLAQLWVAQMKRNHGLVWAGPGEVGGGQDEPQPGCRDRNQPGGSTNRREYLGIRGL